MRVKMIPTVQTFQLESVDPYEGEYGKVSVRQATEAETIEESNLFAEKTHRFRESGQYEVASRWNPHELIRHRAYRLLTDCNLADEDGKILFEFVKDNRGIGRYKNSKEDFNKVWGLLDPVIVDEIYSFILQVNPQWQIVAETDAGE